MTAHEYLVGRRRARWAGVFAAARRAVEAAAAIVERGCAACGVVDERLVPRGNRQRYRRNRCSDSRRSLPCGRAHPRGPSRRSGLQKPEIIAPAIWVAAPILPGTPTAEQAKLIADLSRTEDDDTLRAILHASGGIDAELDALRDAPGPTLRSLVELKRQDQKVINEHYKHVDGTSFAAPIVSSAVAQILEACPTLTPMQIKRLLIDTAERIEDVTPDKQGWGVVQPAAALLRALGMKR